MDQHLLYPTEEGTPQGGIISPVLANLALDGLEAELRTAFPRTRTDTPMVNLVRYADDFLITGRSKALLEEEVKPLVERFLKDRGLELSPEKTRVTHIEEGFNLPPPAPAQVPERQAGQTADHPGTAGGA
jgi:RNA-directed DNA polymerase